MNETFFIQSWDEHEDHIYFTLRKVKRQEKEKVVKYLNFTGMMEQLLSTRKVFTVKLCPKTKRKKGYFYDESMGGGVRELDEEEEEEIDKVFSEFLIRKVFKEPERRNRETSNTFQEVERFFNEINELLNRYKEAVSKMKQEEFELFIRQIKNGEENKKVSPVLKNWIVFELQKNYLFNNAPSLEPP